MASISDTFEYIELCCSNFDATAPGGQFWKGSTSPLNEIIYSWPKFYWTQKTPDIVGMKVISATIHNVWDTVNTTNQTFIYTIGGVPNTITVPVNSYTGATLAATLQTLLSAITPGLTVTFSASQLFTFTQTISAVAWNLTFTSKQSMYYHLGFLPVSVNGSAGVGSTVTSTITANPDGPRYLYLNSRQMGPLINFNLTDGNVATTGGPQICKVPITGAKFAHITYADQNPTMFFDFFVGTKFENFDLYWTLGSDQDQVPLDMKGSEWNVKLGFIGYRLATRDLEQKPKKRGSSMISS